MRDRLRHQQEVRAFLQRAFGIEKWTFTIPLGTGNETYFAHSGERSCFIKVGAYPERTVAMSEAGLSPPVLAVERLEDGTFMLVQANVEGRTPRRSDYHEHIEQVATLLRKMHNHPDVQKTLPAARSSLYSDVGHNAVADVRRRWEVYKATVPSVAAFVDSSLDCLARQVEDLTGSGLVASHNDFCNANLLLTGDGRIYVVDLEAMSMEDPARDVGVTLWWYYPPEMRSRFLQIAGYDDDPQFQHRLRVRTALHCLSITLPRTDSFDSFDPSSYGERLADFRAALAGEENPQGYGD
ncbi:MAG TPA: aminoglycoside phosphotransferase family protein [Chloroflexia bacterium]|nr:aminoglycoside phosphotransferase family protein [Chloroflexia bacterium]